MCFIGHVFVSSPYLLSSSLSLSPALSLSLSHTHTLLSTPFCSLVSQAPSLFSSSSVRTSPCLIWWCMHSAAILHVREFPFQSNQIYSVNFEGFFLLFLFFLVILNHNRYNLYHHGCIVSQLVLLI